MKSKATFKPLLDQIFVRKSRNHNDFESLFLLLLFLVHLDDPTTPTLLPMAKITHDDNINVLNAVTPPILNGTAHCTNVEHVDKQHLDTCHEHVQDDSMTMGFVAIMT
jgi:hypothetical protein